MPSRLIEIIEANDPAVRNTPLDQVCQEASLDDLLTECRILDQYRQECGNLYHRVRALFFLYAIHRFHIPRHSGLAQRGLVPFEGYAHLLARRFPEAIDSFLALQEASGPSDAISSALSLAYHRLGFQALADQVRRSVRAVRGNRWMFRVGHPQDHPLRVRPELLVQGGDPGPYPLLREQTPVRMDLTHSAWSDIFFLGMDYPEAARVLNISVDLGVHDRDTVPRPPIETVFRIIDEPLLRLVSVDLETAADIVELSEVFDFARDYLGLLKAAVIAAGIVPPGVEGSGEDLSSLLARVVGPGKGIEVVSHVRGIPKGSRLAVSTNLLASLITVCMRATGQTKSLEGLLDNDERRIVTGRAILGEWLGGSGGGWQDSGGIWPGMKLICGRLAEEGDPEFGISRGRLLPDHILLGEDTVKTAVRRELQESVVLVHGGMAQNVGPVLEMVTEKYLLRCEQEWKSRRFALHVLNDILEGLRNGDVAAIGSATSRNFRGPIREIIPSAANLFTDRVIAAVKEKYPDDYLGFCMLGGMSGGGMGFMFRPQARAQAQQDLLEIMSSTKRDLEDALPFAMDPVVYDFTINETGTVCDMLEGEDALLPPEYYSLVVPGLLKLVRGTLPPARQEELDRLSELGQRPRKFWEVIPKLFEPPTSVEDNGTGDWASLEDLLAESGFDPALHEEIRGELQAGRIGLAQNRLPSDTGIRDAKDEDVVDCRNPVDMTEYKAAGEAALAEGRVAVVTLAAGAGSRWTQGAGIVKALHPFCWMAGEHRTFSGVHLAKSRRTGDRFGVVPPHVFTTSYLTHDPIARHLESRGQYDFPGRVLLSPGRTVGLRMVPTERDLRFAWEELPQELLDEQAQKVQDSLRATLIRWATQQGEGSDYTDNAALQCLHPVGHWFEVPNLLRNGTLATVLDEYPDVRHLLLHNIDTLGADLDPTVLGHHLAGEACLTFEVIGRRIEDRGGGLATVDGHTRLIEGLALPREEDEFKLSYYNTLTTWINIDRFLDLLQLTRADLRNEGKISSAVRELARKIPTYITLKDVKKRWGHGQEDVFPVTQFEKLWGDMSSLPEVACKFLAVARQRGQQLKGPEQLDGWSRDGSQDYVEKLCAWE